MRKAPSNVVRGITDGGSSRGPLIGDGRTSPVPRAAVQVVGTIPATGKLAANTSNVTIITRRAGSQCVVLVIQGLGSGTILLQIGDGTPGVRRRSGGKESRGEGNCNRAERTHVWIRFNSEVEDIDRIKSKSRSTERKEMTVVGRRGFSTRLGKQD